MKKLYYLLAFLFCLCVFGTCLFFLSTASILNNDFFYVFVLSFFSCAGTIIFGYASYSVIKENRLYDKAAREQTERDWYYHYAEQMLADELYGK